MKRLAILFGLLITLLPVAAGATLTVNGVEVVGGTFTTPDIGVATGTSLDASGAVSAGNLTINSGSITDTSGAISFGNETLSTTGDGSFGTVDLTDVTDGNIPSMASGAGGFEDSPLSTDGTDLTSTGSMTADGFDAGDANITNVGNIALDSISSDSGGAIAVTLGSDSGDDFNIDSGGFVYEGDNNRVGIGTASPVAMLDVAGTVYSTGVAASVTFTDRANYPTDINDKWGWYADGGIAKLYHSTIGTTIAVNNTSGNVGIGTTAPGNPLAVNRSGDGVIVDFESADTVEGNVSIAGNTTSYNAFVGSHYTQLQEGQSELPVGAVVVSTGEIIPCSVSKQKYTKVKPLDAVNIIDKADAVEIVNVEVEDKDNILSQESTYSFDSETSEEKEAITYTYGTKTVHKKRLKDGVYFHPKTRQFYTIKPGYIKKDDGFYLEKTVSKLKPNKEYFVYVDTTTTASDKSVYGVMLGKMSDDAKGMSFGKDTDPVYLIAQVGLFKIRVTDTNGNIENGDYLETSTRAMEAQKQTSGAKLNSTIAKAMIDVDWSTVDTDPDLGYKWKLIPCTF